MKQFTDFLHQCTTSLANGVIFIAVCAIIFFAVENLFHVSRAKKSWRANLLDLQYLLLGMFYAPFIYFLLSIGFAVFALQLHAEPASPHVSAVELGIQLVAMLLVRDCLIYLRHRIFHTRPVWAFHSIHHGSEEVNWLSAVRFHPVENLIESAGEVALFLICAVIGCDPKMISLATLIIGFYNLFIHANLRWTFGPLHFVLVSPVFHRWHHSDRPEAQDKNFAAMFSFIDLVLGTFYMPKNLLPETVGLAPEEKPAHPRTFVKQLLHPFRKR